MGSDRRPLPLCCPLRHRSPGVRPPGVAASLSGIGQGRLAWRLHLRGLGRIYSQGPSHPSYCCPPWGRRAPRDPPVSRLTPLVSGLKGAGSESYFHRTRQSQRLILCVPSLPTPSHSLGSYRVLPFQNLPCAQPTGTPLSHSHCLSYIGPRTLGISRRPPAVCFWATPNLSEPRVHICTMRTDSVCRVPALFLKSHGEYHACCGGRPEATVSDKWGADRRVPMPHLLVMPGVDTAPMT